MITTVKCVRHKNFDRSLLEGVDYADTNYRDHKEIFHKLKNKQPYTVTILIENLDPILWRRKDYCKQTRVKKQSRYIDFLYKAFYKDYFNNERRANEVYSKWLDKYRKLWIREHKNYDIDDYIIRYELEPRYKNNILKRYSNHRELFKARYYIDTERFYHLPAPLNHIDWRNPYDNIFVWKEGNRKLAVRGGSGSSGQREINSKFIYGYSLINNYITVPSSLFIYGHRNTLWFIKQFSSLSLPAFDIGSNYLLSREEEKLVLRKTRVFEWEVAREPIKNINFIKKV